MLAGYAAWSARCLLTPLALWSVSNHAVLVVARIGDIIVGTALFTVLLTNNQAAKPAARPSQPSAMVLLMAWFVVHIGIAAALLFGGAAAARPWFGRLNLAWIEIAHDERMAAMLHLGVAIAVLLLAAALPGGTPASRVRVARMNHRESLSAMPLDATAAEMRSGPIVPGSCSESPLSSTSITAARRP